MSTDRVVALVDMDCFYVQVEQRLNPSYVGKPCAVVQYNTWKGGGIIAVSYEARNFGVTRQMRGDDAKQKCPEIILARVPELRGKADLTRYRDAGAEVIEVLQTFADVCERASVDEAYLDLTDRVQKELQNVTLEELVEKTLACSHIIGYTGQAESMKGQWLAALSDENVKLLAMGAVIVQQAREAVKKKTGFTCSAGIAHNKVLAKIAGGTHKPNQQTLLPQHSVPKFFQTTPIGKVRFFGGKFGQNVMTLLQVKYMSELTKYSREELQRYFGEKSGVWLYDICRGYEYEPVRPRQLSKSCGCGKNFTGTAKLVSREKVRYWMFQLASEISDRLKNEEAKNNRTAKLMSVGLRTETNDSATRSFPFRSLDPESICENAMQVIKTFNTGPADRWEPGITSLSLNASKFEEKFKSSATSSIASFFATKINEDVGKEKEPTSEQTEEIKQVQSSTFCENPTTNTIEPRNLSYQRSEIDQSAMHELPYDICNEIQRFLGVPKTPERVKRTSNGIEKYTVKQTQTNIAKANDKNKGKTTHVSFPRITNDDITGDVKTSVKDGYFLCSKCGQEMEESKKEEHKDFHFALDLHKRSIITLDGLQADEPPKKRQKGTISKFFLSKKT